MKPRDARKPLPNPLKKEHVEFLVRAIGGNMFDDYLMVTDFAELPKETRKAFAKIDKSVMPYPILLAKPVYQGKEDMEALKDMAIEDWNNGRTHKDWFVAKSKEFSGIVHPPVEWFLANLPALRGAPASMPALAVCIDHLHVNVLVCLPATVTACLCACGS